MAYVNLGGVWHGMLCYWHRGVARSNKLAWHRRRLAPSTILAASVSISWRKKSSSNNVNTNNHNNVLAYVYQLSAHNARACAAVTNVAEYQETGGGEWRRRW